MSCKWTLLVSHDAPVNTIKCHLQQEPVFQDPSCSDHQLDHTTRKSYSTVSSAAATAQSLLPEDCGPGQNLYNDGLADYGPSLTLSLGQVRKLQPFLCPLNLLQLLGFLVMEVSRSPGFGDVTSYESSQGLFCWVSKVICLQKGPSFHTVRIQHSKGLSFAAGAGTELNCRCGGKCVAWFLLTSGMM